MLSNMHLMNMKKTSLQGVNTCTKKNNWNMCKQKGNHRWRLRACCFPSCRGSITLEASFVLPIFFIAMTLCLLFGQMIIVRGDMHHGLMEAGKEMAIKEYEKQKKENHGNTFEARLLQARYAKAGQRSQLIKLTGLTFAGSKFPNSEGEIELHMRYWISVTYPFFGRHSMYVSECIKQKAFTGYTPTEFEEGKGYAYVTKYGKVYHSSLQCTHIMLQISNTKDINRYTEGKTKYRACSKCIKGDVKGQLYIPKEGECYHSSLSCSGLTREVRKVTVWETKNMKLCSRCAGGK